MNKVSEQFKKYILEHSRLHDPEVTQSSVELVPIPISSSLAADLGLQKQNRKGKVKNKKSVGKSSDARAEAPIDPADYKTISGYVQWLKSLEERSVEPTQTSFPTTEQDVENKDETAPRIEISPQSTIEKVALFQDHQFEVQALDGQKVELTWRPVDGDLLQRVVMDRVRPGLFRATISIPDGEYLIGYSIDGCIRPDARQSQRLILRSDGVFTRLKLSRHLQEFKLQNKAAVDELVQIESDAEWLVASQSLLVPAKASARVQVRLLPEKMSPGLNEGRMQVFVRREGSYLAVAGADVRVNAEAYGAIPRLSFRPREFGWILQGQENLELEVEVTAVGQGPLSGMIMPRSSEKLVNFRLNGDANPPKFSHTFVIDSAKLPSQTEGVIKLTLVTDSYLTNYRTMQAQAPYRLIYLKKSLPALLYGRVRHGATSTLRLEVARSDGKEVDLEAFVPGHAAGYLEAYRARADTYSFRFDTRSLRPGSEVAEVITLVEQRSGLHDQIKMLAEVSGS